jgi:hypothetical protein
MAVFHTTNKGGKLSSNAGDCTSCLPVVVYLEALVKASNYRSSDVTHLGDGLLTSKVALTIKTLGVEFQFLESH